MWTSLLTPTILLGLLVFGNWPLFFIFLTYVLIIKNIQALVLSYLGGHYDPWFPYLIFFDQVVQSLAKIWAFAYMHRQAWTNQEITAVAGDDQAVLDRISRRTMTLRLVTFLIFVGYIYLLLI
jgi:glycosyltransferase Alg8